MVLSKLSLLVPYKVKGCLSDSLTPGETCAAAAPLPLQRGNQIIVCENTSIKDAITRNITMLATLSLPIIVVLHNDLFVKMIPEMHIP